MFALHLSRYAGRIPARENDAVFGTIRINRVVETCRAVVDTHLIPLAVPVIPFPDHSVGEKPPFLEHLTLEKR